ncbi:MAG: NAD-binding protein [Candidatus Marinimicrobia bacterium]|nr:NAD-binding protein [Candidatus Neomarinimicrobiota bacterium]
MMRKWFKYIIRNRFIQVVGGIFLVMMTGGLILRLLEPGEIAEGGNPFWWAIVTMTTVGYGDYYPATPTGRLFAIVVMFAGISLTALLTATISSIFVARKIREDKGLEKLNLSDHIILCGWNKTGEQIVDAIQNLSDSQQHELVLINDLGEDDINRLKNRYTKIDLYFVAGDFSSEPILERANLQAATTVMIIPNQTKDDVGGSPDEKTIFATLTIKAMSPNIRVVAYLNNRENLTHIKRANADEVVLSDDFGAFMVAAHVMDPGIPQAVNTLLDSKASTHFRRVDIPQNFINKSFDELFNYFREKKGWILVGVYSEEENLGIGEILSADSSALDAFIERKLKEGGISLQDESRVSVVINPSRDYLINPNERAIIIP